MKRCNKCNMIMGDNAKTCLSCKQSLENNFTYICNNCGQVIPKNVSKCSRCGARTIYQSFFDKYKTVIAGSIVIIAIIGCYQMDKSAEKKEIIKDHSLETSITSYRKIKSAPKNNDIEFIEKLLKKYGINDNVIVTTAIDDTSGILAVIENSTGARFVIIDKKDNRIGLSDFSYALLDMDMHSRGLIKFPIEIYNDTKDADENVGVWNGQNHKLFVNVEYRIKNNGDVEPGMIKTMYGEPSKSSEKYDKYLHEQRNVDMINLLITDADEYARDYEARNSVL